MKYCGNVMIKELPLLLMGLALSSGRSVNWHWLRQAQGRLLARSHRSHPSSTPPDITALPCKPGTAYALTPYLIIQMQLFVVSNRKDLLKILNCMDKFKCFTFVSSF